MLRRVSSPIDDDFEPALRMGFPYNVLPLPWKPFFNIFANMFGQYTIYAAKLLATLSLSLSLLILKVGASCPFP